jgi:hypothetical protein
MIKDTKSRRRSRAFVLGRDRFARISEIEGIRTTREQDEEFQRFDREGLSASDRRRILRAKYGRKK